MDFEDEKKKYLDGTITERRAGYHCGGSYVPLGSVRSWFEHFVLKSSNDDLVSPNPSDPNSNGFLGDFKPINDLARKVSLWSGNINLLEIDGIVNSSGASLTGPAAGTGSSVNRVIHDAAGPYLRAEGASLGECEIGHSKTTGAYKLPSKYVIHTVGPQQKVDPAGAPLPVDPQVQAQLLANCYKSVLTEAQQFDIRTLAFPCISTGNLGFPSAQAAHIALYEIRKFLEANPDDIDRIIFVTYAYEDFKIYEECMQHYFPVVPELGNGDKNKRKKAKTQDDLTGAGGPGASKQPKTEVKKEK